MILSKLKSILKKYLIITGLLFNLFFLWMILGWPVLLDSWLDVTKKPFMAKAIVVVPAGLGDNNIPVNWGWQRIDTALQLYYDGYASQVIFSGGGFETVSEAQAYADAAIWMGLPEEAVVIDPYGESTVEHPGSVQKLEDIELDTPLIIVTSAFHSRRTAACFKKYGFTLFRVVDKYRAEKPLPEEAQKLRTSRFSGYKASGKVYNDIFKKLRYRTGKFFMSLREVAALVQYKLKKYI